MSSQHPAPSNVLNKVIDVVGPQMQKRKAHVQLGSVQQKKVRNSQCHSRNSVEVNNENPISPYSTVQAKPFITTNSNVQMQAETLIKLHFVARKGRITSNLFYLHFQILYRATYQITCTMLHNFPTQLTIKIVLQATANILCHHRQQMFLSQVEIYR